VLKETQEKRLVMYRRRGQGFWSRFMQEECEMDGPALRRSVGKRSATHPCITDRPLMWHGIEDVKKTQWNEDVARRFQGNGRAQNQLRICDRSWEDTSEKEGSESKQEGDKSKEKEEQEGKVTEIEDSATDSKYQEENEEELVEEKEY